ncbi:MAG: EamA family transporter [Polyangiaceae bacterium]|nr:EamA family transporter [Polyangiaceae bacterium]
MNNKPASFALGGSLAVLSALCFGLTTPLVQRFGHDVGTFTTAALLYGGAAMSSLVRTHGGGKEAPLRRRHLPRVFAVAFFGALVAPVCLAWGLQRTSGTFASLMLNSEVVFTVLLARALFREPIGGRVAAAISLMLVGGAILVLGAGALSMAAGWGALAIVAASLAWAADNTLTRPLADFDPREIVRLKGAIGAGLSFALAFVAEEARPSLWPAIGLAICGLLGYGVSLRLYLGAQRRIGAARTGSIFAAAPFIGAAVAWTIGERVSGGHALFAGILYVIAIYLHLTELHGHVHRHESVEHEHAHRHDDGHHEHLHDLQVGSEQVVGKHSHPHRHEETKHEHPHAPDVHHQHTHK